MSKRFFKNYQEFISETSSIPTFQAPIKSNPVEVEPIPDEVMVYSDTYSTDKDLEQINKNAAKHLSVPAPEYKEKEEESEGNSSYFHGK